ncbi:MAG: hypothetical protein CL902_00225 [Dehalococcoidia bacterium]|nr:hypothetical protein [Dehalococcoidia bacterium]
MVLSLDDLLRTIAKGGGAGAQIAQSAIKPTALAAPPRAALSVGSLAGRGLLSSYTAPETSQHERRQGPGGLFGAALTGLTLPWGAAISTLKESIDLLQGEGFSPTEWWNQASTQYGFGDLIHDERKTVGWGLAGLGALTWNPLLAGSGAAVLANNIWADRIVGAVGDIYLDPLTHTRALGAFARAGGWKGTSKALANLSKTGRGIIQGVGKATSAAQKTKATTRAAQHLREAGLVDNALTDKQAVHQVREMIGAADEAMMAGRKGLSIMRARRSLDKSGDAGRRVADLLGLQPGMRGALPGTGGLGRAMGQSELWNKIMRDPDWVTKRQIREIPSFLKRGLPEEDLSRWVTDIRKGRKTARGVLREGGEIDETFIRLHANDYEKAQRLASQARQVAGQAARSSIEVPFPNIFKGAGGVGLGGRLIMQAADFPVRGALRVVSPKGTPSRTQLKLSSMFNPNDYVRGLLNSNKPYEVALGLNITDMARFARGNAQFFATSVDERTATLLKRASGLSVPDVDVTHLMRAIDGANGELSNPGFTAGDLPFAVRAAGDVKYGQTKGAIVGVNPDSLWFQNLPEALRDMYAENPARFLAIANDADAWLQTTDSFTSKAYGPRFAEDVLKAEQRGYDGPRRITERMKRAVLGPRKPRDERIPYEMHGRNMPASTRDRLYAPGRVVKFEDTSREALPEALVPDAIGPLVENGVVVRKAPKFGQPPESGEIVQVLYEAPDEPFRFKFPNAVGKSLDQQANEVMQRNFGVDLFEERFSVLADDWKKGMERDIKMQYFMQNLSREYPAEDLSDLLDDIYAATKEMDLADKGLLGTNRDLAKQRSLAVDRARFMDDNEAAAAAGDLKRQAVLQQQDELAGQVNSLQREMDAIEEFLTSAGVDTQKLGAARSMLEAKEKRIALARTKPTGKQSAAHRLAAWEDPVLDVEGAARRVEAIDATIRSMREVQDAFEGLAGVDMAPLARREATVENARAGGVFYHGRQAAPGSKGQGIRRGAPWERLKPWGPPPRSPWSSSGMHVGTKGAARERIGKPFYSRNMERQLPIFAVEVTPRNPYLPNGEVLVESGDMEVQNLLRNYGGKQQDLLDEGYDVIPYVNMIEEPGSLSYVILDPASVKVRPTPEWSVPGQEMGEPGSQWWSAEVTRGMGGLEPMEADLAAARETAEQGETAWVKAVDDRREAERVFTEAKEEWDTRAPALNRAVKEAVEAGEKATSLEAKVTPHLTVAEINQRPQVQQAQAVLDEADRLLELETERLAAARANVDRLRREYPRSRAMKAAARTAEHFEEPDEKAWRDRFRRERGGRPTATQVGKWRGERRAEMEAAYLVPKRGPLKNIKPRRNALKAWRVEWENRLRVARDELREVMAGAEKRAAEAEAPPERPVVPREEFTPSQEDIEAAEAAFGTAGEGGVAEARLGQGQQARVARDRPELEDYVPPDDPVLAQEISDLDNEILNELVPEQARRLKEIEDWRDLSWAQQRNRTKRATDQRQKVTKARNAVKRARARVEAARARLRTRTTNPTVEAAEGRLRRAEEKLVAEQQAMDKIGFVAEDRSARMLREVETKLHKARQKVRVKKGARTRQQNLAIQREAAKRDAYQYAPPGPRRPKQQFSKEMKTSQYLPGDRRAVRGAMNRVLKLNAKVRATYAPAYDDQIQAAERVLDARLQLDEAKAVVEDFTREGEGGIDVGLGGRHVPKAPAHPGRIQRAEEIVARAEGGLRDARRGVAGREVIIVGDTDPRLPRRANLFAVRGDIGLVNFAGKRDTVMRVRRVSKQKNTWKFTNMEPASSQNAERVLLGGESRAAMRDADPPWHFLDEFDPVEGRRLEGLEGETWDPVQQATLARERATRSAGTARNLGEQQAAAAARMGRELPRPAEEFPPWTFGDHDELNAALGINLENLELKVNYAREQIKILLASFVGVANTDPTVKAMRAFLSGISRPLTAGQPPLSGIKRIDEYVKIWKEYEGLEAAMLHERFLRAPGDLETAQQHLAAFNDRVKEIADQAGLASEMVAIEGAVEGAGQRRLVASSEKVKDLIANKNTMKEHGEKQAALVKESARLEKLIASKSGKAQRHAVTREGQLARIAALEVEAGFVVLDDVADTAYDAMQDAVRTMGGVDERIARTLASLRERNRAMGGGDDLRKINDPAGGFVAQGKDLRGGLPSGSTQDLGDVLRRSVARSVGVGGYVADAGTDTTMFQIKAGVREDAQMFLKEALSKNEWGPWVLLGSDATLNAEVKAVIDAFAQVNDPAMFGKEGSFWRGWDKFQTYLKAAMIATPGFVNRNIFGAFFNAVIDGVNPQYLFKSLTMTTSVAKRAMKEQVTFYEAAKAFRNEGVKDFDQYVTLLETGVRGGGQAVSSVELDHGLRNAGWRSLEMLIGRPGGTGKQWSVSWKPWSPRFVFYQSVRSVNSYVEDIVRLGVGMDTMRWGGDANDAIARIAKTQFDYDELTQFERQWAKRFFPFYTWTRKNVPYQLNQLARHPAKYNRILAIKRNMELGTKEEDIVPDYFLEPFGVRTPWSGAGGVIYSAPDIPFQDLARYDPLRKGPKQAGQNVLSMLTPILKAPLEAAFGKQIYSGVPFTGRYQLAPVAITGIPGLSQIMEQSGFIKRASNGDLKMRDHHIYVFTNMLPTLGLLRRLFPNEPKYQRSLMRNLISTLGGVSVSFNTDEAKHNWLTNLRYERQEERQAWKDMISQTR